jgi:ribonuclease-3 family protein
MATGMEALVGYLYLSEQFERLSELISLGLKKIEERET